MAAPVTNPGDQDIIRDRQNRLLQEQRQRLEELKALPGSPSMPDAPAMPADSRCFAIDTIDIEGAGHLPGGARSRLLKPYLGQCLGVVRLNELLKVITEYYLSSGLVTSRAYLPQQDLSSGHLRVLVVEGTLEGLDRAEDSGLSARELAMAFPGADGELLNCVRSSNWSTSSTGCHQTRPAWNWRRARRWAAPASGWRTLRKNLARQRVAQQRRAKIHR